MQPLEGKRQAIVYAYMPSGMRRKYVPRRLQILRKHNLALIGPFGRDMRALACAYAFGADGVVVDVK
jgi:hypothetical protein